MPVILIFSQQKTDNMNLMYFHLYNYDQIFICDYSFLICRSKDTGISSPNGFSIASSWDIRSIRSERLAAWLMAVERKRNGFW